MLGDKVKFCPGGGIKTGSEQCDSSGGPSALERRLSRARSGDEISVDELRNELRSKYPNLSDQGISNLFQEITQSRQSQIKDGKIDASAARSIVNNMKSGVQLRAYANSVSGNQAKALYDAARQAASGVDSIQEELAEMVPKAQQCMQSDQWCVGAAGSYSLPPEFTRGKTSDELPKTFDIAPVRGQGGDLDPGYFFKDTRELVYRQTYRAQQGPYQNYANTIGSTADYDDNSAPEQMAAIRQRHQENMASIQRQRAEMQRIQQQGESLGNNMYRLNGVIYGLKDNAAAEYDPRRLNYKQIVGRNTRRDATFIKGTGAAAPSLPAAGSGGRARPTNRGTGRRTIGAPRGVDALRLPSSNGLN